MDNLTHSLAGAVLGQMGLKRKTRKGMAALVLGANGPDIDVFLGWVPWLPLATHRGFTHGIIGTLIVMPVLIAALLWALDRWQKKATEPAIPLSWRWLLILALIGSVTHPLLDLQTVYAVQLLSPFSTTWFHTDTLFIIDIWLLLLLGGAFLISRRRERAVLDWQRPAIVAMAGLLAYVGGNGIVTAAAAASVSRLMPDYDHIVASPPPFAFWRRELVWRSGGAYFRADYDPLSSQALKPRADGQSTGMRDPIVRMAIARSPEVQHFLRWSIMPFAKVERQGCTTKVIFNDARYSLRRGLFEHSVIVPTPGIGCI